MAYSFQTFTLNQVLTSAQMNQVEFNIRDHSHGNAGVSLVPDNALSSNVVLEDVTNKFTALQLTDAVNYVVGGGTANAHTATFTPPFTALVDGMEISFRPFATNDNAVVTFKLDATIITPVKKYTAPTISDLGLGDITVDNVVKLKYSSASGAWVLLNPATAATTSAANLFTADQTINKAIPQYLGKTTVNSGWGVKLTAAPSGILEASFAYDQDDDRFKFQNELISATVVAWERVTGKQTLGTVPLARMQRTEQFGSSTIAITAASPTLVTLSLGTLNAGDRILIQGEVRGATDVTGGDIWGRISGAGGTLTFGDGKLIVQSRLPAVPATTFFDLGISAIGKVGTTGSVTIHLLGFSAGSNTTNNIHNFHAIVLNNG